MKLKRIAVAMAVTALGATVAAGWRRRAAAGRRGAESEPGLDEPPCDDDVSAFIDTLARTPGSGQRLAQALRAEDAVLADGQPDSNAGERPVARPSGSAPLPRGD